MKLPPMAVSLITLALIAPCFAQEDAAPSPPAEEPAQVRPDIDSNPLGLTVEDHARRIMQRHMRSCWRSPTDLPEADRLVVTVRFELNEDGTLRGQPRVVSPRNYAFNRHMRTAIERAVTAVRACSPYPFPADPELANRYDIWDEQELTFRTP